MTTASVLAYTLAFTLLLIVPGPDFALVFRNATRGGRTAGVATALGVACGLSVHAIGVALGLGAVLATSALLFTIVKYAGVAYLAYLGISSLVAAVRRDRPAAGTDTSTGRATPTGAADTSGTHAGTGVADTDAGDSASGGPGDAGRPGAAGGRRLRVPFRQGLLCNVLNPKAVLVYLALMPQFLPAGASLVATLTLSAITVGAAAIWFTLVSLAVAATGRVLRRPRVRRSLDAITGSVMLAFGARLALMRP